MCCAPGELNCVFSGFQPGPTVGAPPPRHCDWRMRLEPGFSAGGLERDVCVMQFVCVWVSVCVCVCVYICVFIWEREEGGMLVDVVCFQLLKNASCSSPPFFSLTQPCSHIALIAMATGALSLGSLRMHPIRVRPLWRENPLGFTYSTYPTGTASIPRGREQRVLPLGLWSKVVHCIGNRVPFWTQPKGRGSTTRTWSDKTNVVGLQGVRMQYVAKEWHEWKSKTGWWCWLFVIHYPRSMIHAQFQWKFYGIGLASVAEALAVAKAW